MKNIDCAVHPAVPFAWPALAVDVEGVLVRFAAPSPCSGGGTCAAQLRVTLAAEQVSVSVLVVESAEPDTVEFARLDLRHGCVFQIFVTALTPAAAARLAREPARVRVLAGPSVVIFAPTADAPAPADFPHEFAPHLLADAPPAPSSAVLPRLATLAALQPFNWLHGCVVDALADAGDHTALTRHLSRWFHSDGHLRYVGPHSEPRADELFGLEPLLMFAALARHDPLHPAWAVLRRWLAKHTESDGLIIDRGLDAEGLASPVTYISIEAIYTVSYPLALAAIVLGEPAWRDLAVQQIRHRLAHLVRDGVVCQRAPLGEPNAPGEQPHWGRANAWFLLGLAKTLRALGTHPFTAEGIDLLRTHTNRLLDRQRDDGLWSVYLDDPAAGPDTSASAGIAAALALGANAGWLPVSALDAACRADAALALHLTPDAFLGGVAQLNRGGDALQRGGYRVLGQFALGLYGQLRAALRSSPLP